MTRDASIQRLRCEIGSRLIGRIDRDYVLLGLPYYLNIGDILIWEGTRQFLKTLPFQCLNPGYRYRDEGRIREDTLILLQGGGNFGDLWRWVQEERLAILRQYPRNPALIFPVSCRYEDPRLLKRDAEELAACPDLTICARDQVSYDLLAAHFQNRILLVPDMAFFINPQPLRKWSDRHPKGLLVLQRADKERVSDAAHALVPPDDGLTIADWPSMEREPCHWRTYKTLLKWGRKMRHKRAVWRFSDILILFSDLFYHQISRWMLIRQGATFVGRYRIIRSTRLHGAILAMLLDKDVQLVDNLDGKISSFYKTWLEYADGVEMVE